MSKSELMGKTDDLAEKMKKVKEEIEGNKPQKENQGFQKKVIETSGSPKLFVTGRLDRKKQDYIAKNLLIPVWVEEEIKAYCRGVDVIILNYLISVGLKSVKESNIPINVDVSEIV